MVKILKFSKKQIISFLLILALALSNVVLCFAETDETPSVFIKAKASEFLKIEMENVINKSFIAEEDDKAFGGKYLRFDSTSDSGEVELQAVVPMGIYRLWLRYYSDTTSGVHVALDGTPYKKINLTSTKDNYKWIMLSSDFKGDFKLKTDDNNLKLDSLYITDTLTNTISNIEEDFVNTYTIVTQPTYNYPAPTVTPPNEHPRVMLTKNDFDRIRKNMQSEEGSKALEKHNEYLNSPVSGILSSTVNNGTNRKVSELARIEARAFDYVINGNEENGYIAINSIKNYLNTIIFTATELYDYYYPVHLIFVTSLVYDWCYPLLTEEDKNEIISCVQEGIGKYLNFGWPLNDKLSAIGGFSTYTMIMRGYFAYAIAIYDEYPELYTYLAGLLESEYKEMRDYWYESEAVPHGTRYGPMLLYAELMAQWMYKTISDKDLFTEKIYQVPYYFLYLYNGNGQHFREGDQVFVPIGSYSFDKVEHTMQVALMASTINNDPYLKGFLETQDWDYGTFTPEHQHFTPVQFFIMSNSEIEPKPINQLPKTRYFGSPYGLMVARTGWNNGINAPDVNVTMKISERYYYAHQHFDAGTFQIYHKGMLSNNMNHYARTDNPQHHTFSMQTIAHNGLLIYDPDETMYYRSSNKIVEYSGGQLKRYVDGTKNMEGYKKLDLDTGKVIGYEFGPDVNTPEYSYISGDITDAYSDKVSEVKRSMMFMPTDNEDFPAVFMVMDKINSTNPSFRKVFQINSFEEPIVEDNTTIIQRTTDNYTGRLTNQTLYPEKVKIDTVGGPGKQWWVGTTNYVASGIDPETLDYGWGRIEISPLEEQKLDYFLNVMYVGDDGNTTLQKAELIETDKLLGGKVLDKITLFNKGSERTKEKLNFSIDGDKEYSIAICGIAQGEWTIYKDGLELTKEIATKDGGMVYFKGNGGNYEIILTNPSANKIIDYSSAYNNDEAPISLIVNEQYIYSDTPAEIVNGRTMVPLRALFEILKAEVDWIEETQSAVIKKGNAVITLTDNSAIADISGKKAELDSLPYIKNGRFMIPIRFIMEQFGGEVSWIERPGIVQIDLDLENDYLWELDKLNIIASKGVEGSEGTPDLTYDNDEQTVWKASGNGAWIEYELEDTKQFVAFDIFVNDNVDRSYLYDIYASQDGENYTKVWSGGTNKSGRKEAFKLESPIMCKYIKFVGRENTKTKWNNITEIKFYGK